MRLTPPPNTFTGAAARSLSAATLAALLSVSSITPSWAPPAFGPAAAQAKELASGSGSRVNKDPISLLRLALPRVSKEARELQAGLEECQDNLARLNGQVASSALQKAKVAAGKSGAMLKSVPPAKAAEAQAALDTINAAMDEIGAKIAASRQGEALAATERALGAVTQLQEAMASGYAQPSPPKEFASLPYLKGRATVDLVLQPGKEHGQFDVEGKLYKQLEVKMVVDGYTSPITAGNFVDLVRRGFYNGMHIQRSDGFVVQTGDPSNELEGSGADAKKNGYVEGGKVRKIPLEVMVRGDKDPIYSATFDDDGRGGYAAAMPFNSYGALGMAREEYDPDSASSQWFWLLFDSDLTPAGKNLLDGRYACFGYTVDGARLLSDVKEGDIIASAKVSSGESNLVLPTAPALAAAAE